MINQLKPYVQSYAESPDILMRWLVNTSPSDQAFFIEKMDGSRFSISEWVQCLEFFLKMKPDLDPNLFRSIGEYLECCEEGQALSSPIGLKGALEIYFNSFGADFLP